MTNSSEQFKELFTFGYASNHNRLLFPRWIWEKERNCPPARFGWTNEELDRAEQNGGYIGKKHGVECYMQVKMPEPDNALSWSIVEQQRRYYEKKRV